MKPPEGTVLREIWDGLEQAEQGLRTARDCIDAGRIDAARDLVQRTAEMLAKAPFGAAAAEILDIIGHDRRTSS